MADVARIPSNSDADDLRRQLALQKVNLRRLQLNYADLAQQCGQDISESLNEAFSGLFEIVNFVNERDKRLQMWWEAKKPARVIMRLLLQEEKFETNLAIKTEVLKDDVQLVQDSFSDCIDAVGEGSKLLEEAQETFRSFTDGLVASSISQATSSFRAAETVSRPLQDELDQQSKQLDHLEEKLLDLERRDSNLLRELWQTRGSKATAELSSIFTGASAAVVTVGAIATGPAWIPIGTLTGGLLAGISYLTNQDALSLEKRCDGIRCERSEIHEERAKIKVKCTDKEAAMEPLKAQQDNLEIIKDGMDDCLKKCRSLALAAQNNINEMYLVRIRIDRLKVRLKSIAIELSRCGYANTRREISKRLRSLVCELEECKKVPLLVLDEFRLKQILGKLAGLDRLPQEALNLLSAPRMG